MATSDKEPEYAMEEGKADSPSTGATTSSGSKRNMLLGAVGGAAVVAIVLAIALPLSLREKGTVKSRSSNSVLDLNISSGGGFSSSSTNSSLDLSISSGSGNSSPSTNSSANLTISSGGGSASSSTNSSLDLNISSGGGFSSSSTNSSLDLSISSGSGNSSPSTNSSADFPISSGGGSSSSSTNSSVDFPISSGGGSSSSSTNSSLDLNISSGGGSSSSSTARTRGLPVVSLESLKETYTTCVDLTADLEMAARMMANQTIESNIQNFFYRDDNYFFRGEGPPIMFASMTDTAESIAAPAPAPPSGGAQAASGIGNIETTESSFESNNQEEGVEEPDVVQSDGQFVWAAYGTEIVKLRVEDTAVVSRTQLPTEKGKCDLNNLANMLLVDDTLITVSTGWCTKEDDNLDDVPEGPISTTRSSIIFPGYLGESVTRILLFDKDTMELKASPRDIKGDYNSARAIGDDVYVITSGYVDSYSGLLNKLNVWDIERSFISDGKNFTEAEYRDLVAAEVDKHVSSFVSDLMNTFDDCGDVQRLSLFQNEPSDALPEYLRIMESISTVTGFNIKAPNAFSAKNLILPQSGWQVYASDTQLVLAAQGWWRGSEARQETYVITYSLADAQASVVGFGSVPGYVLNQYSIDHQVKNGKEYLLFATTTQQRWELVVDNEKGWSTFEPVEDSTSQITVLEVPTDETLTEKMPVVGKVEGLGKPGEQIYSVRFQENRAFVVTFERTDPFYTIDITDPENPEKVGELEIPGFSSYLHPIGENLILGVGQNVDPDSPWGRQLGLQISIFDVEDFANPIQIHTYTEDGSNSEAEYNPMAFRYLDETGLLILPLRVNWSRDTPDDEKPFSGFKIYKADEEGIFEYMSVNHESRDTYFHRNCWRSFNVNLAGRSLVFSGVLWTMQGTTIHFSDLSTRIMSSEPIVLDEDDEVQCYPPFPDLPVFPFIEEVDCSIIRCVAPPDCGDDEPFTPAGDCCAQCPGVPLPVELPDCAAVLCALPDCGDDSPFTPEGQCCPVCPSEGVVDLSRCAAVSCLIPDCGDEEPFTPAGECCAQCPGAVPLPIELPDCATVLCDVPDCGDDSAFTPEGQCCPVCPGEGIPDIPDLAGCAAVSCLIPDCGDVAPFTPEGECCPQCP